MLDERHLDTVVMTFKVMLRCYRNFTLQQVSGLADITQSYRGNPDRTEEALHKVSVCVCQYNYMPVQVI